MIRFTLTLVIALFSCSAHSQIISEIEGRLSVHPAGDITSQMIGDTLGDPISGKNNIYIGHRAGFKSNGENQIFIGGKAGKDATNSSFTTAIGFHSGDESIYGSNSFYGAFSGYKSVGSNNTFFGLNAGSFIHGNENIIIGNYAGPDTASKIFSDRLYVHNNSSDYPLLYGEFDNGLLTVHHGNSETEPSSAEQGLRIQRRGTSLSWTQHVQSDGDLGFYYGGAGSTLMTLKPDGTLIISGDIIADNIPAMSQINELQEENKRLKSQVQELTQVVKKLMATESER